MTQESKLPEAPSLAAPRFLKERRYQCKACKNHTVLENNLPSFLAYQKSRCIECDYLKRLKKIKKFKKFIQKIENG